MKYGFEHFNKEEFYATTHVDHEASKNVLKKVGFKRIETFDDEKRTNRLVESNKRRLAAITKHS
jgi:RimJ/RimL family protein N-acetyltransferase